MRHRNRYNKSNKRCYCRNHNNQTTIPKENWRLPSCTAGCGPAVQPCASGKVIKKQHQVKISDANENKEIPKSIFSELLNHIFQWFLVFFIMFCTGRIVTLCGSMIGVIVNNWYSSTQAVSFDDDYDFMISSVNYD